jgi:hypothetical protein
VDRLRLLPRALVGISIVAALAGCSGSGDKAETPGLEPRGTVLTTVKPARQNLTNRISLNGKVAINPIYGIVAPADGELRYVQRQPATTASTQATWVATVWDHGTPHKVLMPKNSILAGRLLDDRATVTAGMPVISAKRAGYAVVADVDSALAYRISGSAKSVQGQIKNGPGPFACKPLGTVAALPAGTIPEPPPATPAPGATGEPAPDPKRQEPPAGGSEGSEPTGLRLVCTAPKGVRLINGAAVTLQMVTDKATDVLVLPVEAVAGAQGKGKVDLVGPDRVRKTVDVVLGLTDGKVVEIKKGLTGDETVAIPGPNLPAAPEGQPGEQPSGAAG